MPWRIFKLLFPSLNQAVAERSRLLIRIVQAGDAETSPILPERQTPRSRPIQISALGETDSLPSTLLKHVGEVLLSLPAGKPVRCPERHAQIQRVARNGVLPFQRDDSAVVLDFFLQDARFGAVGLQSAEDEQTVHGVQVPLPADEGSGEICRDFPDHSRAGTLPVNKKGGMDGFRQSDGTLIPFSVSSSFGQAVERKHPQREAMVVLAIAVFAAFVLLSDPEAAAQGVGFARAGQAGAAVSCPP